MILIASMGDSKVKKVLHNLYRKNHVIKVIMEKGLTYSNSINI